MENKENRANIGLFKWYDWTAFALFVLLLLLNVLFVLVKPILFNELSNFLFQLLSLIIGIYSAVRISQVSERDKKIEIQKSIAKTSIRQIRNSQSMVVKLIKIVRGKKVVDSSEVMQLVLDEIVHHLENLVEGLSSSESAFIDILGEEFKEERKILIDLIEDLKSKDEKLKELEELKKKGEREAETRLKELKKEIEDLNSKMIKDIADLPIASSFSDSKSLLHFSWSDDVALKLDDFAKSLKSIEFPSISVGYKKQDIEVKAKEDKAK